jgi:hypothetical protein
LVAYNKINEADINDITKILNNMIDDIDFNENEKLFKEFISRILYSGEKALNYRFKQIIVLLGVIFLILGFLLQMLALFFNI